MLEHISDEKDNIGRGLIVAAVLISLSALNVLCHHQYFYFSNRTGIRLRAAYIAILFQKITRLSASGVPVGAVTNMLSNDTSRLIEAMMHSHHLWAAPIEAAVATLLLFLLLGVSALPGIAVTFFSLGMQAFLARQIAKQRSRTVKISDTRVKMMSEIFSGVKLVKLMAWERPFSQAVAGVREQELASLRLVGLLRVVSQVGGNALPIFAAVTSFALYIYLEREDNASSLDAATVFTALSLFNLLRLPLSVFPHGVKVTAEASVAMDRLQKILDLPEVAPRKLEPAAAFGEVSVSITNASFAWPAAADNLPKKDPKKQNPEKREATETDKLLLASPSSPSFSQERGTALKNISVCVNAPQLCAVVGPVGSGKSTLLSCILGELSQISGSVSVRGKLAYVPQQPWILNATLKDNIIVGQAFFAEKYEKVLRACALLSDLAILPAGDMTEIGERGINLSGGQKQRVSLARALYSDADVYLLDDPLSAVDVDVGQHIFTHCIKDALSTKTVILVTHQLQYLSGCDRIVMMNDCCIQENGTFPELVGAGGVFAAFVSSQQQQQQHQQQEQQEKPDEIVVEKPQEQKKAQKMPKAPRKPDSNSGALIVAEDRQSGEVKQKVYTEYARFCGGVPAAIMLVAMYVLGQILRVFTDAALTYWVDTGYEKNSSESDFYLVYFLLSGGYLVVSFVRGLVLVFFLLNGSTEIHNRVFASVLRAPMQFFDQTPTGRLLNRFSSDMDQLDEMAQPLDQTLFFCPSSCGVSGCDRCGLPAVHSADDSDVDCLFLHPKQFPTIFPSLEAS
eukprot:TRINITY_DN8416_c0_g1_i1.p1 TRINITY_DN8416_c0_g1~~TRINITY_DN8416_c0_g1_i1.p1  ORF type:complete len:795 (+),score=230.13 TRINITY_DN8416_c0_g1_i1:841-3225(+)